MLKPECPYRQLRFDSKESTAHSRKLPEFNLRWFWPPAAAKAVSHSKRMSVRETCRLPDAAPATELRKNIHPASPVCMAGTDRVLFFALQGLKPRDLTICPQA